VVRRAGNGAAAREVSVVIASSDATERIDTRLAPLFAPVQAPAPPEPAAPIKKGQAPSPPAEPVGPLPHDSLRSSITTPAGPPAHEVAISPPASEPSAAPAPLTASVTPESHRERNLGIGLAVGGGAALVLGIALLSSYSSLQRSIDNHATRTRSDFD